MFFKKSERYLLFTLMAFLFFCCSRNQQSSCLLGLPSSTAAWVSDGHRPGNNVYHWTADGKRSSRVFKWIVICVTQSDLLRTRSLCTCSFIGSPVLHLPFQVECAIDICLFFPLEVVEKKNTAIKIGGEDNWVTIFAVDPLFDLGQHCPHYSKGK